jgi:hypothetical protein
MDSLSSDITLLTINAEDKMSCRAGEIQIPHTDGTRRSYGRFSWTFAQALLNTPPHSSWIRILAEMERLIQTQPWEQPLLFHGQPTEAFSLPA